MKPNHIVCLLSDLGSNDRFSGIMKGVAISVDLDVRIIDITHEILPFNIQETSYLLNETIKFWPVGTSFVIVVDPGVGSERKALALITRSGHFIFCPDNGIISSVEKEIGFKEVRIIDTLKNRLPGIPLSHTFHGRDIFIYNAARVASGKIQFNELGFLYTGPIIRNVVPEPVVKGKRINGVITHIEEPYGNLCTNIPANLLLQKNWKKGDKVKISILSGEKLLWSENTRFVTTFAEVKSGASLIYQDSTQKLGVARNLGRIFEKDFIHSFDGTKVILEKI